MSIRPERRRMPRIVLAALVGVFLGLLCPQLPEPWRGACRSLSDLPKLIVGK